MGRVWIEITFFALKVLGVDLVKQLGPVGTLLAELLIGRTIKIALLLLVCVFLGHP